MIGQWVDSKRSGRKSGDETGNGPQAGTPTWDAQGETTLYVISNTDTLCMYECMIECMNEWVYERTNAHVHV